MSTKEIREYLEDLDLCSICVLRYKNVSFQDFSSVVKDWENEATEENAIKRQRLSTCIACLDLFQSINSVAKELIENSSLKDYECSSVYTSIQIPIALLVRELSIWLALIEKFPGKIDESKITVDFPFLSLQQIYYYSLQIYRQIFRLKMFSNIYSIKNYVNQRIAPWNKIRMEFWLTSFMTMTWNMMKLINC